MSTDTSTGKPQLKGGETKPQQPSNSPPIIDIRTVLVTPDMAQQWLGSNYEHNRSLRPDRVAAYARDMSTGKWQLTGETIKITPDGTLIDGQHRLSAVILAGTPVYMNVAMNVPVEAYRTIDANIPRTTGDRLKGITERNRNQIGAVVRRVLCWQRKDYVGRNAVTATEQLDAFENDPSGFAAATAHGIDVNRQKICSAAMGGVAFYLFHTIDPEEALVFFDHLKTGANLPEAHPILTVRNRLTRAYGNTNRTERLTPDDQLALLIRAWNALRQKRSLDKAVVVKKGNLNNQNFPQPL